MLHNGTLDEPPNSMSKMLNQKDLLRQSLRIKRRQLNTSQQEEKSKQIATLIHDLAVYHDARSIAGYWSNDGEINPSHILEQANAQQKICYLPIVIEKSKQLQFAQYQNNDPLLPNRFGILEPEPTRKKAPISDIDLILIPLVGFDNNGHRVGMGEGYYDQSLAELKESYKTKKPFLLGLAYELQRVDTLPTNEWDIPLHGILTEQHFYSI